MKFAVIVLQLVLLGVVTTTSSVVADNSIESGVAAVADEDEFAGNKQRRTKHGETSPSTRSKGMKKQTRRPTPAPVPPTNDPTIAPTEAPTVPLVDIPNALIEDGGFETLVAAVIDTDLVGPLSGTGPFTVFAPTDAAFAALDPDLVPCLLEEQNLPTLQDILLYHVANGKVLADELTNGMKIETLLSKVDTSEKEELTVDLTNGMVKINEATVERPNVLASNGVIHVIDQVLVPPGIDVEAFLEVCRTKNQFVDIPKGIELLVGKFGIYGPAFGNSPISDSEATCDANTGCLEAGLPEYQCQFFDCCFATAPPTPTKAQKVEVNLAIKNYMASELEAQAKNLHDDTHGDKSAIDKSMDFAENLNSKSKYGIIRVDYAYRPTRGDPGSPLSFSSNDAAIFKVEGWNFAAAQQGVGEDGTYPASEFNMSNDADKSSWNTPPVFVNGTAVKRSGYSQTTNVNNDVIYRYEPDVVEKKMKEAIAYLEKQGVSGITADVGFSQAFQESIVSMASVPVVASSLQQLTFVAPMFNLNDPNKKILVMTANGVSFNKAINELIPKGINHTSVSVLGLENSLFGKWVDVDGSSFSRFKSDAFDEASVEEALASVVEEGRLKIDEERKNGVEIVAIVQECAELPAYSNALRHVFDLPVYDTGTAIEFVRMGRKFGNYGSYMVPPSN